MDTSNAYKETKDETEQCQGNNNAQEVTSFLDKSGSYDLTLIVEDRKINVCKAVLCVASPVFQTMLKSDFKEKDQAEIELPEKNYEDFVEFLCCFYPDKLKYLTEENVYRVLPLAIEYQMEVLEDRGHKLLVQLVNDKYRRNNEKEVYRQLQLAELYHFEELKNRCIELASDLSLAKMDKGASDYPVSDKSALQIRYLALQKLERAVQIKQLYEKDDKYLFEYAYISANKTGGGPVYLNSIVTRKLEELSGSSQCVELLRAARLWVRYFNNGTYPLSNITSWLNAKTPEKLSQYKSELDLLPDVVKKSLTIR